MAAAGTGRTIATIRSFFSNNSHERSLGHFLRRLNTWNTIRNSATTLQPVVYSNGIHSQQEKETLMSLILYLIGCAFVIGGITWALVSAGVSTHYIMITVLILIGIAILSGVTRTRQRD